MIDLRNNSCQPYFIVIQIWVGIIFMNKIRGGQGDALVVAIPSISFGIL